MGEHEFIEEDSELGVRKDPQELQGYILTMKNLDRHLLIPRGTLEELALANRDRGRIIIKNLIPSNYENEAFFKGTVLTYDSIIAIATKAYLKEQIKIAESYS